MRTYKKTNIVNCCSLFDKRINIIMYRYNKCPNLLGMKVEFNGDIDRSLVCGFLQENRSA